MVPRASGARISAEKGVPANYVEYDKLMVDPGVLALRAFSEAGLLKSSLAIYATGRLNGNCPSRERLAILLARRDGTSTPAGSG